MRPPPSRAGRAHRHIAPSARPAGEATSRRIGGMHPAHAHLPSRCAHVARLASQRAASVIDVTTSDNAVVTPALATRLAHEWLVTEPPQTVETRAGRQIGEGL